MEIKGVIYMPNEILYLTAQIVISHTSMSALTTKELVAEIKNIHDVLISLDKKVVAPVPKPTVTLQRKPRKVKMELSAEAKAVQNVEGLPVGDPDYMEFMESREG
jgi:predicted transcriptional regulator